MDFEILDLETPGTLSAPVTVLCLVVLFGIFGRLLAKHVAAATAASRMRRRAEEAAREAALPLSRGERVVVGYVELADGETTAARVEIDQQGSESESSGSWSFTWTETNRRVTMRPFYLRLEGGERVRVEPGNSAFLVDALDGVTVVDNVRRTRCAELTPGERVFAAGVLAKGHDPEAPGQAYRGSAEKGWVMSPPPGGELLLSSEPLGERFRRAASRRLLAAGVVGAALAIALGVATPTLLRLVAGERAIAEVVDRKIDEGDETTAYYVLFQVREHRVWLRTTSQSYQVAAPGRRARVTHVELLPAAGQVGFGEPGGVEVPVVGFVLLFPALLLAWFAVESSKRWYDKKLEEQGSGRLADNLTTRVEK